MPVSLLLKKDSLNFDSGEVLTFPENVVANQEVKDVRQLEKLVSEFLSQNKISKNTVAITLAPEIVFSKSILLTDFRDEKYEADKFLATIPFEPTSLAVKSLKTETDTIFYAANKHLFFPLVRILTKMGWKVTTVCPEEVGEVNFLTEEQSENLPDKPKFSVPPRTLVLGIIFLVVLIMAMGTFIITNKKTAPTAQTPPFVSGSLELPATSAAVFKTKETLSAKVFNGTGKEGEAARVAAALEKLGLTNIQKDNLEIQETAFTSVAFSSSVSAQFKEEVASAVGQLFTNRISQTSSSSASFDITVVTGR